MKNWWIVEELKYWRIWNDDDLGVEKFKWLRFEVLKI